MADSSTDVDTIVPVPPPWKLKGTVYMLGFWTKAGQGTGKGGLPEHAYSPLEANSPYADPAASGEHLGGLSQIQIIRYSESPVGPYDELIVCPGFFAYEREDERDGRREKGKNARITRIYVSQKNTCWNGRTNWNIPKHLARFDWEDLPEGKTKVKVYPHDTPRENGDEIMEESQPSDKFLLQATFQPLRWAPSFPLSLSWLKYTGIDASLVQPPLPDGRPRGEELAGTERWCRIMPGQSTKKALLGWIDLSQRDGDGAVGMSGVVDENFWPGQRRWHLALKMENADIDFGKGEYWDAPRTKL